MNYCTSQLQDKSKKLIPSLRYVTSSECPVSVGYELGAARSTGLQDVLVDGGYSATLVANGKSSALLPFAGSDVTTHKNQPYHVWTAINKLGILGNIAVFNDDAVFVLFLWGFL